MSQEFWAKKRYGGVAPPTVLEHCREVCRTAESLYRAIRTDLMDACGIDVSTAAETLTLLKASALLHDFAKVNSAFQEMLRARPGEDRRQPVRHEIMAGWLLADHDFLGKWFARLGQEERIWPIIWAISGHHLKMTDPARTSPLFDLGGGVGTVTIPLNVDEVHELLCDAAAALNVATDAPRIGETRFDTADDDDDGLEQCIHRFAEASCKTWDRLQRDPEVVRRTALLKALLISADVAASALTCDAEEPSECVERWLSVRIDSPQSLDAVVASGIGGNEPLAFQKKVRDSSKPATIVIAGCGNGKTAAAYLWAQRHAVGKKLWFTYPTTGTASAGYEGYLYDHPDVRSALIHGRDEVDLRAMRDTAEDERSEGSLRLDSLRAWGREVIACTVDTVLGLMQNRRRPLFSFPAIVAGAFVFDEIHSYDACLFGALLRFLEVLPGVPVLLMSASIPPDRLKALRDVLGDRLGDVIAGDPLAEGFQRYRLESRSSAGACLEEVEDALRAKQKVLWVCNTVNDAIAQARQAHQWTGVAPEQVIVYHSRFRYGDRVARQNKVLAEFQYAKTKNARCQRINPHGSLVIATQVCEMSLDISADLMVTAECPLPSFVQRLGRLNRYAAADDPWPCLVYPFSGDPYNENPDSAQTRGDYRVEMAAMRNAVREFGGKACCQRDLAQRLDTMAGREEFKTYAAWLDDGWVTEPAQLRDGDAGITLIRDEDLGDIEQKLGPEHATPSQWTFKSLVPWTIPMRNRRAIRYEKRAGGYLVAPAGAVNYCNRLGATWASTTN